MFGIQRFVAITMPAQEKTELSTIHARKTNKQVAFIVIATRSNSSWKKLFKLFIIFFSFYFFMALDG